MKNFHSNQHMFVKEVYLLVNNLERSIHFYRDILGLTVLESREDYARLGTRIHSLIHLTQDKLAKPLSITLGLYHFALLLPERKELAKMIYRLKEMNYPLTGASDHGVSEALYLDDPNGHGIEIYVDRDEKDWPLDHGKTTMFTKQMDVRGVLSSLDHYTFKHIHEQTIMGHLHLHVDSIPNAQSFFMDVLGFQKVLLYGGQALFISDQGYHHHIGLNTWHQGAPLCEERQIGLKGYKLFIPKDSYLSFIHRLENAHIPLLTDNGIPYIVDPLQQKIYIETN